MNLTMFSIKFKTGILCFVLIVLVGTSCSRVENTTFVDPYIGSGGHGHVFVGASVPFGADYSTRPQSEF